MKPNHGTPDYARDVAFQKITNRVAGTKMAARSQGFIRTLLSAFTCGTSLAPGLSFPASGGIEPAATSRSPPVRFYDCNGSTSDRAFGPPARPDVRYTSNSDQTAKCREGPCVDGSKLARKIFTSRAGRCSHVFGL